MKRFLVMPVLALAGTLVGPGSASAGPFAETPRQRRQERRVARQNSPDADEWRQAWQQLSPADQATLTQAWIGLADHARNLTPQQKQRMRDAAQQTADRLRRLTPAQRAQLRQQLERARDAYQGMNVDDKAALLARMSDTIDRLKDLTPAQREALKSLYRRLLGL
jgi:hypothetical protein